METDNKGNEQTFDDVLRDDRNVMTNVNSVIKSAEDLLAAFNKLQNAHIDLLVKYRLVFKLYKLFKYAFLVLAIALLVLAFGS